MYKYPRTPHLPWSPGASADDRVLRSTDHLDGQEIVVTHKLDGENATLYADGRSHARSLNSRSHTSRSYTRALAAGLVGNLPEGWRVCGENLQAQHAIRYPALPGYFVVFSIWTDANVCLGWDDTTEWAALLDLPLVPTLYRGMYDEPQLRALVPSPVYGAQEAEGYVVRLARDFQYLDFSGSVAKWVRPQHVQPNTRHWFVSAWATNGLA